MTKPLRLLVGLLIVVLPAFFGWHFRSPFIIPVLGAIYVPLYFFGKMGAWQALGATPSRNSILKAVPVTFCVQNLLAGIFYLVGLGLGTLFRDNTIAASLAAWDFKIITGFAVLILPVTAYIAYAERHSEVASAFHTNVPEPGTEEKNKPVIETPPGIIFGDGDEFSVCDRIVTPNTFYQSPHFSRSDAVGIALTNIVDHKGEKPKRRPKNASDAMLRKVEERLGVKIPDTLRKIYKIQNGGCLPPYYVPSELGAPQTFDHWITAFADDYNDLAPLERLKILQDDYNGHFDPEYGDEEDKTYWIPGADKLVILTSRSGYGTALDYRASSEPGVLLFDHNNPPGEMELMKFDSFDSFLAALREIDPDPGYDDAAEDSAYGAPPNPLDADAFWASGNPGTGLTPEVWQATGEALDVALPEALYPFYQAANGGISKFQVALTETEGDPPFKIFPTGADGNAGEFLRAEHFVPLAVLSDRLYFSDNRTPWRDLFPNSEKLIVISAAFDSAVMLDYSNGGAPSVLAVPDLDMPGSAIRFASVENFLSRLRRYGVEAHDRRNDIGDARLSARRADAATFWRGDTKRGPVSDEVTAAFIKKWGLQDHGLPQTVIKIYAVQNGGAVRFRYTPPQIVNAQGYTQYDRTAKDWLDAFPDELLPVEDWQKFEDWRAKHGLAKEQSPYEFVKQVHEPHDSSIQLNLFVIGDHTSTAERMITLLDLSKGSFASKRNILTLQYDQTHDTFETVFGPVMVDNIYSGLFQIVKARKAEM